MSAATNATTIPADVAFDALLDIVDDRAWLRADGYLPGPDDIAVPMGQVRQLGLRRGDRVTGFARVGEPGNTTPGNTTPGSTSGNKPVSTPGNTSPNTPGNATPRGTTQKGTAQKGTTPRGTTARRGASRNPAQIQVETVNGQAPGGRRRDFYEMTALFPNERLRLETGPADLDNRVIDLVMPIGKGQRALIVAPPKAGKTTILHDIANAIATNHPEVHLMAVLVDERPEEVTDFQRSIKGEVVAATFDRPPAEHAALAELAVERAKRLVEQGRDVVILLDSITRLGRAYNLLAPGRGRTLSGGLDSTALYPPKRLLGAARNLEGGGSLTIIATALVENGSAMDGLIFEEFKSTGNAELKLDRQLAEARVFPAIDVASTGTRHDEMLLARDELAVVAQVRRALTSGDARQSLQQLLDQLRTTPSNNALLRRIALSLAA